MCAGIMFEACIVDAGGDSRWLRLAPKGVDSAGLRHFPACFPAPCWVKLFHVFRAFQGTRPSYGKLIGDSVSGMRYHSSGIKYQVSGSSYQVSGVRYQVSGTRYQVSGIRYEVSFIRYQVSVMSYQFSGTGIRYQSSSIRY